MYFKIQKAGKYKYLQIVETYKVEGKVHQTVIANLGNFDKVESKLEGLIRSGARLCKNIEIKEKRKK